MVVGSTGSVRVELYRKGLPALSNEKEYGIVEPPEPKEQDRRSNLPDFEVIAVSGPEDADWEYICDDPSDTDPSRHASNFMMNDGKLYIYYSEAFPRFATEVRRFEQHNDALAASFRARYEMWLAVHSLLMYQETESVDVPGLTEEVSEEVGRQERTRLGVIAAMIASQEVKSGLSDTDEEDTVAA
ncbi:MAG: hypothetical protein E5W03_02105 [Mesorhizobium sp.]|nr:MAG: hypothetical protein E5W03_02105 [Mesorhizobium sp.]